MTANDLVDIWRICNLEKKQFTWTQKKPLIRRRLDYWLVSTEIQDDLKETNIITAINLDHSAITLTLNSLDKQPFGPSCWKFNSSLLEDASLFNPSPQNILIALTNSKILMTNGSCGT